MTCVLATYPSPVLSCRIIKAHLQGLEDIMKSPSFPSLNNSSSIGRKDGSAHRGRTRWSTYSNCFQQNSRLLGDRVRHLPSNPRPQRCGRLWLCIDQPSSAMAFATSVPHSSRNADPELHRSTPFLSLRGQEVPPLWLQLLMPFDRQALMQRSKINKGHALLPLYQGVCLCIASHLDSRS